MYVSPEVSPENVDSVQQQKYLWLSAAIGAVFVFGKYITPKKKGNFLFRGKDVIDGGLETLLGTSLAAGIGFGGVLFYNNVGSTGSKTVAVVSTLLMLFGSIVSYKFFLSNPVGRAKDTLAAMVRKILQRGRILSPPEEIEVEPPRKVFATAAGGTIEVVHGNLFNRYTEAWVNPWNSNYFTGKLRWMHSKGGVSGSMAKVAGHEPFDELATMGVIPVGQVRFTGPGSKRDHLKGIYHTATMSYPWGSKAEWTANAVTELCNDAEERGIRSIAAPLIGAGHGDNTEVGALQAMFNAAAQSRYTGRFIIVVHKSEKLVEPRS